MAGFDVTDAACVAAYEFEDNANDLSGEGNTLTLNGTADYATGGANLKCLTLDGNSDYGETADAAELDLTTAFTLSAWVKKNAGDSSGERGIISKGGTYNLILFDNGKARVEVDAGGSHALRSNDIVVSNGIWTLVTGTFDGSNLRLYINGVEVAPSPDAETDSLTTNGNSLTVGLHSGGFFFGEIDRVFVFNTAKSAASILEEYETYAILPELEQEGFRFRDDNDDENSAAWLASQDTDITRPIETNTRLRVLIDTTNDAPSYQYQLEYRVNAGSWKKVQLTSGFSSELTTGGTPSASHENGASEGADEAFDGSSSTKWLAFNTTPWLQYRFAASATHAVTKYALTSGNDDDTRDPKDWTLQGSNDGSSWTTVDTQADQTFASRGLRVEYTCPSNTTAYEYYRLNVVENNGNGSITQLAELELYENQTEEILMSASANITASGENTTAQLTAPTGKTTSDFSAGRIQDDQNPSDGVDVAENFYTELEWCIIATDELVDTDVVEFRVTLEGTLIDTYTVVPGWTIGSSGYTGDIKKVFGIVQANVKKINGVAIASIKSVSGVSNI